jgi:hypothetical protein
MNLMQPWNSRICEPSWAWSLIVGHQISLLKTSLVQGEIKIASFHTLLLLQFHIKALSCFMYKINWSNYYSRVNLVGHHIQCRHHWWIKHGIQWWGQLMQLIPQTFAKYNLLGFWTNLELST